MRILYTHRIQSRDGQSVHVDEMVAALRAAGHEVEVVGPAFYAESNFGGESRMVARLRRLLPGALGEIAELAYNIPAFLALRRAARTFRPEAIYERYNLYYLAGSWLARRLRVPYLLEVNSPLADERARFSGLRLQRLAHALERQVWKAADRVLPVTGVLGDMIAATGVPRDRIQVVPNGVVLDRFDAAPRPAAEGRVVLGFVGFVRPWHGLDAVLNAMAEAGGTGIALTVIGDGPVRPALEAQATALGLGARVHFTGLVDHHAVPHHVAQFDIALQPKVVAYASPLKIFDYMAAGRAIVAPDAPNIREILEHGRTALLFDPDAAFDSPSGMWAAIQRLAGDAALRARLGAAARAELELRDFTWAGNARRVVEMAGALARR
jgi:glycosyltransferase involved in cell wall biosynthesis